MAILSIKRDWNGAPTIVRLSTTDTLAQIMSENYLIEHASEIHTVNVGEFTWSDSDMVLAYGTDGFAFLKRAQNGTLVPASGPASVTVNLTAADITGMYAAPVEILPSMGADTLIRIHDAELVLEYGSAQYAAGGAVLLQYDDTANGLGLAASATVAAAVINGFDEDSSVGFSGASAEGPLDGKSNLGIYLSNQTAAFTTGDSDVKLTVWFSVISQ